MFRSFYLILCILLIPTLSHASANEAAVAPEVIFIKLGGSIVTNKMDPYSVRLPAIAQFAKELAEVMKARPHMKFIIGHGSGSFGHTAAIEQRFDKKTGFPTIQAAAIVSKAALDLHAMIIAELVKANIPAFSMPPSATGMMDYNSKRLVSMDILQIQRILEIGGVPVVFGDVVPFSNGDGTYIAYTEEIFAFLTKHFHPSSIFLLGEVLKDKMEGMYNSYSSQFGNKNSQGISEITPETWGQILSTVTGAKRNDETGILLTKVKIMMDLVKRNPEIKVYVASGLVENVLKDLLVNNIQQPTCMLIHATDKKKSP